MRPCRHCGAPSTSRTGPATCVDCQTRTNRATTAARNRRWRAGRTARVRGTIVPPEGMLPVVCWCEREIGMLTPRQVLAGEGISCGLAICTPEKVAA